MIRVSIAGSGAAARRLALELKSDRVTVVEDLPDVVIALDVEPETLDEDVPVLLLTSEVEVRPLASGNVRGWLKENAPVEQITAAIEAIAAGLTVSPYREEVIAEGIQESLTARETEVLRTLADGLGNKEIAARLGISEHTAKFHVAQILGKFGAGSRTEAVRIGIRRGLIPI